MILIGARVMLRGPHLIVRIRANSEHLERIWINNKEFLIIDCREQEEQ